MVWGLIKEAIWLEEFLPVPTEHILIPWRAECVHNTTLNGMDCSSIGQKPNFSVPEGGSHSAKAQSAYPLRSIPQFVRVLRRGSKLTNCNWKDSHFWPLVDWNISISWMSKATQVKKEVHLQNQANYSRTYLKRYPKKCSSHTLSLSWRPSSWWVQRLWICMS